MTRWLRLALAVQLAFFGVWGTSLMTSHRDGTIVWLSTEPVDPRDLLSGHYVALRYRIASASSAQCDTADRSNMTVYVRLAAVGDAVETTEGTVVTAEPVGCQTDYPGASPGEIWIAGQLDRSNRRIVYGIERMFVGEESPLRHAVSGTVVAKVAINDRFEPRLLGLVSTRGPLPGVVPSEP